MPKTRREIPKPQTFWPTSSIYWLAWRNSIFSLRFHIHTWIRTRTHHTHSISRRSVCLRWNVQGTDGEAHQNRRSIFRAVLHFYRWLAGCGHLGYETICYMFFFYSNLISTLIACRDMIRPWGFRHLLLLYVEHKWICYMKSGCSIGLQFFFTSFLFPSQQSLLVRILYRNLWTW